MEASSERFPSPIDAYFDHLLRGEVPELSAFLADRPATTSLERAQLQALAEEAAAVRDRRRFTWIPARATSLFGQPVRLSSATIERLIETQAGTNPARQTGDGLDEEAKARLREIGAVADVVATAPSAPVPERVGRYEVERLLAEGGGGRVFLGRDPELGRAVVLKTIPVSRRARAAALEQLRQEARVLARLDHRGICPILDLVHDEQCDWMVLPLLPGTALLERAGMRNDVAFTVALIEKVARALDHAHAAGVVHLDLKPGNLLLTPEGEPVILDFGIAAIDRSEPDLGPDSGMIPRANGHPDANASAAGGTLSGTPLYMAPEQAAGRSDAIDRRTDVHALGVLLYEFLTGVHPYDGPDREAVLQNIRAGRPRPPRALREDLSRDLEAVCLKAMAPAPEERYATALALADDLARVAVGAPTKARPLSAGARTWRTLKRRPVAVLAFAALALAGFVTVRAWQDRGHNRIVLARARALDRVLDARLAGEAPPSDDLLALAPLLPDPAGRAALAQTPLDIATLLRLRNQLLEQVRSQPGLHARLLEPRGGMAEVRPSVVVDLPSLDGTRTWRVSAHHGTKLHATFTFTQAADGSGPRVVPWGGPELVVGDEYWLDLALDAELHPQEAATIEPQGTIVRVVAPERRAELLAAAPFGDAARDGMLRALGFEADGLYVDAVHELERLQVRDDLRLDSARRRLLARVLLALEEPGRVDAMGPLGRVDRE